MVEGKERTLHNRILEAGGLFFTRGGQWNVGLGGRG